MNWCKIGLHCWHKLGDLGEYEMVLAECMDKDFDRTKINLFTHEGLIAAQDHMTFRFFRRCCKCHKEKKGPLI